MKKIFLIIAAVMTVSAAQASAASAVLTDAGLSTADVKIPSPQAPKSNFWMTLRKVSLNEAQPDMNDTLVGIVRGADIDKAVKELNDNGFKASAFQDNNGGYMVMVDVAGLDAADMAIGLARYYYITDVKVGQKVFDQLFASSRASGRGNMWLTLRKIQVNEAQDDTENTLVGIVRGADIDKAVKELNDNGFKASAFQDNNGGYMVMVDVTGLNAADYAVGLARYYYITEVKVSRKVYNQLFSVNK